MNNKNRKNFTKSEVEKSTLQYFNGDELATDAWIKKYCLKDDKNYYELNPDDMHRRISGELARIENKYSNPLNEDLIYESLKNFKRIVPQGSPMSGIGNNYQIVSIGNCFVVGNNADSYGGIFRIDEEQTQLMKRRGGVGHDLSKIRPKGSPVKNSAISSTGVVPFMERYSNSTKEVAQDGRRGALMLSISIKHPDAEEFIDAKLTQGKVTGANISIKITDDFMDAVVNDKSYLQTYPVNLNKIISERNDNMHLDDIIVTSDFDKLTPVFDKNGISLGYIKKINARKLWNKIIYNAWKSAEPGILFWDKIASESIPSCYGLPWVEVSTNPCGELPLPPYDSCRLLCINLYEYVIDPFTPNARFNWELFDNDVQISMRYMDDIVDLEIEKIDVILNKIELDSEDDDIKNTEKKLWIKIRDKAIQGRRTGLGVTAEGDMIAAMGLIYGNDDATDFSVEVHRRLKLNAYRSSVILAKERGAFPIYDVNLETNNPFIMRIANEDPNLYNDMLKYGRRNIALLTIAPTGTASLMTQTSSGIEPVFLPVYKRRRKINPQEKDIRIDFIDDEGVAWQEYLVFHHKFENWLLINGYDVNVVKSMSIVQVDEIIKKSPYYKATSNDVNWVKKVEMQGRVQLEVDHSISVTVNLPKDTTEDIVAKVYETGWSSGCKGMTVYRDGCRSGVLIGAGDAKKSDEAFHEIHAPKRPKRLKGEIHRFQNNLEKWIAIVGLRDGRPYEIFTGKLDDGLIKLPPNVKDCEIVKTIIDVEELNDVNEICLVKKKRYDIEYIDVDGIKQIITGINQAFNPEFWNYAKLISAIMRQGMPTNYLYLLVDSLNFKEDHINTWKNGVTRVVKKYVKDGEKGKGRCPNCGGTENLQFIEGCLTCKDCGSSKCS